MAQAGVLLRAALGGVISTLDLILLWFVCGAYCQALIADGEIKILKEHPDDGFPGWKIVFAAGSWLVAETVFGIWAVIRIWSGVF